MLTSITKYSKSFFVKIVVAIIILPFVFWGMGDVFKGGNQNIIGTIDSEKISTQEFINYLNRLELTDEQRKNLGKSNLLEKVLSDYVGRKIIELEVKNLGITVSDKTLKNIIINDELFLKNKKFSRVKYEKFLLETGYSASVFENNLLENEKKTQLLDFLSQGVTAPDFLIENLYNQDNQIKTISYVDLNNLYKKNIVKENDLKQLYEANKNLFVEDFKTIDFTELNPNNLTGANEYSEGFFKIIDKIENNILDGFELSEIINQYNLKIKKIDRLNSKMINEKNEKNTLLDKKLFDKFFSINKINSPEIINYENKYYLAVVQQKKTIGKKFSDQEIQSSLKVQVKLNNKFKKNTKITKEISSGLFTEKKLMKFASKNNLQVMTKQIEGIKDNKIFSKDIIREIFKLKDGKTGLITDKNLTKNFIIFSKNTEKKILSQKNKDYEDYKSKTQLAIARNIYRTYDKSVNSRYKVNINNKVINRLKNSF